MPPRRSHRRKPPVEPAPSRSRLRHDAGVRLVVIAAGAAAYANSLGGAFLLDDFVHVLGNPRIRQLSPVVEVILDSSRPLVDLSLAVNWAIGGRDPVGYHVFNLVIHILAALVLFGLTQRCVRVARSNDAVTIGDMGRKSTIAAGPPTKPGIEGGGIALVVALVWVVHPLGTQSVTYVIQRAESMMGLCYLLTLYCVARGRTSEAAPVWHFAAVLACAAGMFCKPVIITAPVVALLLDRAFFSASWRDLVVRRWLLYLGLAGTWLIAASIGHFGELADPSARAAGTVGFNIAGLTPWQYLASQGGVILHYIRLCFWPQPLVFDYAWPAATSAVLAAPACIAVLAMFAASLWAFVRRPTIGFAAMAFFVILAPTSSFIPVADLCVEHRMYLPLACVVALVVVAGHALLYRVRDAGVVSAAAARRLAVGLVLVIVVALAVRTHLRNRDYRSELAMWETVVSARPDNARARAYVGTALLDAGRVAEGIDQLQAALRINDDLDVVRNNLANGLAQAGQSDEAIAMYEEIIARQPALTHVHFNLALVLQRVKRYDEAAAHYAAGLSADPEQIGPRMNLGDCLAALGRVEEAAAEYRAVLQRDPRHPGARERLAALERRSPP